MKSRMDLQRKSQVSIFLVMALLIILLGALYFFYKQGFGAVEGKVPDPRISPVKIYVEDCLKRVTEDGLDTIGLSGGYIEIPEKIKIDPRAYLTSYPGVGFKIPYWWHNGIESVPTEEFIRGQLSGHIKNTMKSCLDNFTALANSYNIKEQKEPAVEVNFNENDVTVEVKYLIDVSGRGDGFKSSLSDFSYKSPTRFKKVYELAKLMMEKENMFNFFERKTIDLISMDKSIPTTDIEATCKSKVWYLSDIRERLKTLLRVNIPYVRVKGTNYNQNIFVPNPDGQNSYSKIPYLQNNYVWDIYDGADNKFKNMKTAFTYDDWPLRVIARPSENGVLKPNPQKGADVLSFLCLYIWHFTYDIRYPVLATIIDQETNTNKAYSFNFPFEVSVAHNQPGRESKGYTLFESEPDLSDEDYCSQARNEITFFTVDNSTGEDIRGVNLSFVCGRYKCDLGESDWLSFGAAAGLTKRLPFCVSGLIEGKKDGFADSKLPIQTDTDGSSYLLMLNPVKDFLNFKVVRHDISNPLAEKELAQNEKASIFIKGKDIGIETFASYPNEEILPIRLAGGRDTTYDVTIYVVDDNDITSGYIGEWKVGRSDLKNADSIVFHVIGQQSANEDEKYLFLSGLEAYSKSVPGPELK